jgi:hypothetical protein
MKYLASVEVDQRQRLIHSADKLREMLGGSWSIANTVEKARTVVAEFNSVRIILPVSGALWFDGTNLDELGQCLLRMRDELSVQSGLPCTYAIVGYDPARYEDAIDGLVAAGRAWKDARTGESGECTTPALVPCSIQPGAAANLWRPDWKNDPQRHRRSLVSSDSDAREKLAHRALPKKLGEFTSYRRLLDPKRSDVTPYEFSDLRVLGGNDSYLGLIKADGDGTGKLLAKLNWTELATQLSNWKRDEECLEFEELLGWRLPEPGEPWEPEQATCMFSWELNRCLMGSLQAAVDEVVDRLITTDKIPLKFPVAPVVAAGEDFWILCRRDLAFELALRFGEIYAERAGSSPILKQALDVAGMTGKEALSLSIGLLFARDGYPFEMQLELAEELLNSAKALRRDTNLKEGCIDFHWLDATGRETVKEARKNGHEYRDGSQDFRLYTRPWSLTSARKRWDVAQAVGPELPSRKWHQLDMVLRQGAGLSELAYRDWWQHLASGEQAALDKARQVLNEGEPWAGTASGLRELFELYETQRGGIDEQD